MRSLGSPLVWILMIINRSNASAIENSNIHIDSEMSRDDAEYSDGILDDVPVHPFESAFVKEENTQKGSITPSSYLKRNQEYFFPHYVSEPYLSYPCLPTEIHISLGDEKEDDDKTSMRVSFSLPFDQPQCHPDSINAVVRYGKIYQRAVRDDEPEHYHTVATRDDIAQFNTTSTETNEEYISNWIYHVPLVGLEYSTDYWYKIIVHPNSHGEDGKEDGSTGTESPPSKLFYIQETKTSFISRKRQLQRKRHLRADPMDTLLLGKTTLLDFTTAPPPQTTKPTKIAIVGDLGQTYNSTMTMLHMLAETQLTLPETPATLVVCAGDMSYANSIQPLWDNWFQLMEPLISRTPLVVAAGNHEIECDVTSRKPFLSYEHRFRMPNRITAPNIGPVAHNDYCGATPSVFLGSYDYGNAFYAFSHGLVRMIVLSSYSDTTVGSPQYTWLEEELKRTQQKRDTTTPWVVVVMHTQFYTTFTGHRNEKETEIMRHAMEPLFVKYKVNLVFSGHDHAYMRTKSMNNYKVDSTGVNPIYLIVGEGGNREHHARNFIHKHHPEEWVEVRDKKVYGFGTLEVVNATSARWEWIMDGKDKDGNGFQDDVWFSNQFYL